MGKNKLAKFAENETFTNLFQHTDYAVREQGFPMRGRWHGDYFKNDNPIILELGCGKGDYTVALARRFPDKNFIGVDRKGARLWRGCKTATEEPLPNVAFIRARIEDIEHFFAAGEVAEIWVTFPDPQVKKERHRLISPVFVGKYKKILADDGVVHLKTDSRFLYEYVVELVAAQRWQLLENIEDVYAQGDNPLLTEIQTFYEQMWLAQGEKISYVAFKV